MHVKATITAIDINPEFGDIFGTEAIITVTYPNLVWSNAPAVIRTLEVSRSEALQYRLGQSIPLLG